MLCAGRCPGELGNVRPEPELEKQQAAGGHTRGILVQAPLKHLRPESSSRRAELPTCSGNVLRGS